MEPEMMDCDDEDECLLDAMYNMWDEDMPSYPNLRWRRRKQQKRKKRLLLGARDHRQAEPMHEIQPLVK